MLLQFILLIVFLVYSTNGSKAPFITKCKADDSKCLKRSAQIALPIIAAGIPELGLETLDPIFFETLDGSSNGISLKLQNFTGTGLKDCIVKKLQRDVAKPKLTLKLLCSLDFRGPYEMDGQVLILHMKGKGNSRVILRKVLVTVEADLGEKDGSDGLQYWTVKTFKFSFDLLDKSTIELQNLFEENEVLAQAARGLLLSSSNEVIKEIGVPIVRAVITKIIQNIRAFFSSVPINELT